MPVTILVADDSTTMRRVLEMTFAGEDAEVIAVDSGQNAVAKAQEVGPDIVLADASMDGMDGYELSRALKADHAGLPVVVLASQKRPYDEAKGSACAVDAHIIKPFDTQTVIDRIRELAVSRRPAAAPVAAPRAPATSTAAMPAAAMPGMQVVPPAAAARSRTATLGFGGPAIAPPGAKGPPPPPPAAGTRPAAAEPSAATPPGSTLSMTSAGKAATGAEPEASVAVNAAASAAVDLASKLDGLGLTEEQMQGVLLLSREVIEQVVWEVVPNLAETIIREEIRRLTAD